MPLQSRHVNIPPEDLKRWIEFIGVPPALLPRVSTVLRLQLYFPLVQPNVVTFDPFDVAHQIRAVEGIDASQMKPETQFTKRALRGLWHKHTRRTDLVSHVTNILCQLGPKRRRLTEIMSAHWPDDGVMTSEIMGDISRAVVGQYGERMQSHSLTGDWIVFAKHGSLNYYLCLAAHTEPEHEVLKRVCISQQELGIPVQTQ